MEREARLKRMHFRAWHRGTREADYMIGGFFDAHSASWGEAEFVWYEALLEEEDVEIMAWAIGTDPVPERYQGTLMEQMQRLDYIQVPR
jgi:antitoxin CptB